MSQSPRRVLTNVHVQHMYLRLTPDQVDIDDVMRTLIDMNVKVVFVFATRLNAQVFLQKVSESWNLEYILVSTMIIYDLEMTETRFDYKNYQKEYKKLWK